jgi:hypothetical protein
MLIVARNNRLQIKSNRNESKQFGVDTIVMQNRINQHSYTILANRSFAQVECNQNPNENIDSIQNRVVPGKSKSTGLF